MITTDILEKENNIIKLDIDKFLKRQYELYKYWYPPTLNNTFIEKLDKLILMLKEEIIELDDANENNLTDIIPEIVDIFNYLGTIICCCFESLNDTSFIFDKESINNDNLNIVIEDDIIYTKNKDTYTNENNYTVAAECIISLAKYTEDLIMRARMSFPERKWHKKNETKSEINIIAINEIKDLAKNSLLKIIIELDSLNLINEFFIELESKTKRKLGDIEYL